VPEELGVSSGIVGVETDSLRVLETAFGKGLSFFSEEGVVGVFEAIAADLKSNAVPGVLGVLVDDPKEANAPDPRPNAEEPPVVGEARPLAGIGEMELKGFRPPCDESPANRFVAEKVR
jgi:hypothetical protein